MTLSKAFWALIILCLCWTAVFNTLSVLEARRQKPVPVDVPEPITVTPQCEAEDFECRELFTISETDYEQDTELLVELLSVSTKGTISVRGEAVECDCATCEALRYWAATRVEDARKDKLAEAAP